MFKLPSCLSCLLSSIPYLSKILYAFLVSLVILVSMSLTGCAQTKQMTASLLKDRGEEYVAAKSYPSLQIPRGIARESTSDTYRIPEG